MEKVVIIGAGGHAKVIVDILQQNGECDIVGMLDKEKDEGFWGIPVIGTDDDLPKLFEEGVRCAFVALGSNSLRKEVSAKAETIGYRMINAVSNKAIISARAKLGQGVAVMPGAVINADTVIGDGCIVNTNASIDHDCHVGAYVHIAPGTNVAGSVTIGEETFIGVGSRIIDGITIGSNVIVGAGTVVLHFVDNCCTEFSN